MKNANSDVYKLKDIWISSFLYSLDELKFIGTKRESGEVWFIFSPSRLAEELTSAYWDGSISVQPKRLFSGFKDLKSIIFNNSLTV